MLPVREFGGLGRSLSNILFPVYLLIIVLGFLGIRSFGMPSESRSAVRALFMSVNAATLTGFQHSVGVLGLTTAGQVILLFLMIVGSLFSMIVGSLAITRLCGIDFTDRQIIFGALIVEAAATAIGSPFLWGVDQSWFSSTFLSASAFGNCGLFTSFSPPNKAPFAVHWVILPMTIIGGLGLPVLMEIVWAVVYSRPMSKHSRAAAGMAAWLYVAGFVMFGACLLSVRKSSVEIPPALASASIFSVESRTGGMPLELMNSLPMYGQWILLILMVIGAGSGSCGGGLKNTTVVELFAGTRRLIRGENPGRAMGATMIALASYGSIVLIGVILLSYVKATNGGQAVLFDAVSAASNVGFSDAHIPDEPNVMYAYSALMLLGRMTPLMLLWWMVDSGIESEVGLG